MMTLNEAIVHAREVGGKMLKPMQHTRIWQRALAAYQAA